MKVLILATNHKSIAIRNIVNVLNSKSIEFNVLNPSQLFLMISNQEVGRNNLFDDYTGKTIRKVDLAGYDVIIPRIGKDVEFSCEVLKYLEEVFNMKTVQSSEAISNAYSKIRTSILLRANGVRTPKTVFVNNLKNMDSLLKKLSKDQKYVIKLDKGSKGKQVSIVSGMAETKSVIDTLGSISKNLIIQDFIENDGSDVRAIVIGNQIVGSYKRQSGSNELRNNISTGGEGVFEELSDEEKRFCIVCAHSVGLDYAGVDLMRSADGRLYCIEVNHCPGMNVQKFSEISIADKLVELAIEIANSPIEHKLSSSEIKDLQEVESLTFKNFEFNQLFDGLKGKVLKSNKDGLQTLIKSKSDLQKVIVREFKVR